MPIAEMPKLKAEVLVALKQSTDRPNILDLASKLPSYQSLGASVADVRNAIGELEFDGKIKVLAGWKVSVVE